jgi:hypothetical protein
MKAIQTGIFGKRVFLTPGIFTTKRDVIKDILLEALPEVSLQEVIVTTSLCMLFSSKKNKHKKNGTLFRFFIEMLMVLLL